jgi:hypothetical protein
MKRYGAIILVGVLGLVAACGAETTESSETGNTNWLKECATDLDCGTLSCYCGTCREPCGEVVDCSQSPEQACVAGSSPEAPPSVSTQVNVVPLLEDDDTDVQDIALGAFSSVYVTGGKGKYQADFSDAYSDSWVARISYLGNTVWEVREPLPEAESIGISVAYDDNTSLDPVTMLSTRFVDGERTRRRTFDGLEQPVADELLLPEFVVVRPHPSQIRTFLGGFEGDHGLVTPVGEVTQGWPALFMGTEGSRSSATDLAIASDGSVAIVGYVGRDPASNESEPFAGRVLSSGEWIWSFSFSASERAHCEARGVALLPNDVTLVAGECAGNWLRGISIDGAMLWEHYFEGRLGAIAASDTGYVVSMGTGTPGVDAQATLLAFDHSHQLLWRVDEPGCEAFHRLIIDDDAVVAVARCDDGVRLQRYRPAIPGNECVCVGDPLPLECGCGGGECFATPDAALAAYQCDDEFWKPYITTGCGYLSVSASTRYVAQTYHYDANTEEFVGFETFSDAESLECPVGEFPICPEAVTCTPCEELATDNLPYCY